MGKKKSYDDLSYSQRRNKTLELAEQMGVDKDDYNYSNSGRDQFDSNGRERKSFADLEKDVASRMSNDYDIRRSLEAASLGATDEDEKERLGNLAKGISNMSEGFDVFNFMKKTHKKELGNSGKFSSANDYANVTDFFVNRDRDNLLDSMSEDDTEEAPKAPPQPQFRTSVEDDEARDKARDERISEYELDRETQGLFSDEGSKDYLSKYKFNVTDGLKRAGVETRGPNSPSFTR